MEIRLSAASAPNGGLGKPIALINGFPADDLAGLWLFEDGAIDATQATFADSSGSGNTLVTHGTYVAPTRRAYGIEVVSMNGWVADTNIPLDMPEFTFLVAMKQKAVRASGTCYVQSFGVIGGIATSPTSAAGVGTMPTLNFSQPASGNGVLGMYESTGGFPVQGASRRDVAGGPVRGDAYLASLKINGPDGTMAMALSKGTFAKQTRAGITAYFDGTNRGDISLGAYGLGTTRPDTDNIAEIYGSALWSRALSVSEEARAMARLRAIAEARGVSFA